MTTRFQNAPTTQSLIQRRLVVLVNSQVLLNLGLNPNNRTLSIQHLREALIKTTFLLIPPRRLQIHPVHISTLLGLIRDLMVDDFKVEYKQVYRDLLLSGNVLGHSCSEAVRKEETRQPVAVRMPMVYPFLEKYDPLL